MMISTKGRYALRVMLDLAGHMEDGCLSEKTPHTHLPARAACRMAARF